MCETPGCDNPVSFTQECEKCFRCCDGECKYAKHYVKCKTPGCDNSASLTQGCGKCFCCCDGKDEECEDEVHFVKCDIICCARKGTEGCWNLTPATPSCARCCEYLHCYVHSDTCCAYGCDAFIPGNKRCSNRKCGNHCDGCQFDKHPVGKYCVKEDCFRRRAANKRCCKKCWERDVQLDILEMPDALRNLILSYWDTNSPFSSGPPSIPDEKKEDDTKEYDTKEDDTKEDKTKEDKTKEDKAKEDKTNEATPTALSYIYIPVLNYGDVSPYSYEGRVIRVTYEKKLGEFPRQLERRDTDIRYALLTK
jgi:hypothetical protein